MFDKLKKYRLIFIKEEGLYAKELKLTNFILPITILGGFLILFFSILLNSKDLKDLLTLKIITHHQKNNSELNDLIAEQQNKINLLIKKIDSLYKKDENLRRLIKLPPIDQDIRKLGIGGKNKNDKYNHLEYLLPENFDIDDLNRKINFIKRGVNLEKISYIDISKVIISQKDYLTHYPAIYPVLKEDRKLSSRFGYRKDPFTKKRSFHDGDDFSTTVGKEVIATADGTVKSSRYYGSFGNYIEIDHGNGYVTAYGHLSKRLVPKGSKVERGDVIGKVGNTGKSTAPHLHYEVRLNEKHVNPNNYYFN